MLNLDKKKYKEMVEHVEIINVFLKNMELQDVKFPKNDKSKYDVRLDYKCIDFKKNSSIIEFYPKFILNIVHEEEIMLTLEFELRAIYKIDNIEEYEDEYILKFIDINIPINVWPYAREIISSITTRIGYPTLVISPYKG